MSLIIRRTSDSGGDPATKDSLMTPDTYRMSMTDYYLAVCTSGHLIGTEKTEKVSANQIDINEAIDPRLIENPVYNVKHNYCPDCGGQVLTQCPNCCSNVQTTYSGPPYPGEDEIPDFCHGCGEAFPWTVTVEAEKQRDGDFIRIDDSDIDGQFYPSLVYEINLCYQVKADQAVLVLNRKLIESLIVDILRSVFTMENIELFYDTENNKTLPLSQLVNNMKSNRSELKKYVSNIDERFFRAMEDLKHRGDASAHAIEEDPSQENIAEKSDQATTVAKILFRLRKEAKTAHRNR